jgi:mono/diheme cytochrome c family protein
MANYVVIPAALAIALCASLVSDPCRAQSAVSEGHEIAQKTCAVCHVIEPNGSGSWTDAPSFESVANRPGMTQQRLADFVQKPHMHMVSDQYTPAQARVIAEFILSQRHK